jgi:mono/diheme cytochrome c family protein
VKAALLMMLACCAIAFAQQAKPVDPDWTVPEKAAQQLNPLATKPELGAGGRKMFERNCAQCHGDAKHERKNNAPDLSSAAVQQETDGALFWRISNGNSRKGMPSFSSFPEGQRWQLVLYIRSMGMK